jgi:hypothetical protein
LLCHVYDPPFLAVGTAGNEKSPVARAAAFSVISAVWVAGAFRLPRRFSAGAFDGIAGMPVSAPAAAAAVVIHSDITKFSSPLNA